MGRCLHISVIFPKVSAADNVGIGLGNNIQNNNGGQNHVASLRHALLDTAWVFRAYTAVFTIPEQVYPSTGGAFPFTVGRVEHGYNVRPDLCATDCDVSPQSFLGKFYTDTLVHDPKALELLVDVIGEVCGFIVAL